MAVFGRCFELCITRQFLMSMATVSVGAKRQYPPLILSPYCKLLAQSSGISQRSILSNWLPPLRHSLKLFIRRYICPGLQGDGGQVSIGAASRHHHLQLGTAHSIAAAGE